jgi:hypothetical protein
MGEEHKEVQYALFPKTINYKRVSDGMRLTTTGMTMHIAKSPNLVAADFHASIVEKWQKINAKNGGTLYGKTFITCGKERGYGGCDYDKCHPATKSIPGRNKAADRIQS